MKENRLRRIFAGDGRTLIVAMDHAGSMGPLPGLSEPGELLREVTTAGADAIMTTFGVARRFGKEMGRAALILRVDGGTSALGPREKGHMSQVFRVTDALRLGADAVACMGFPGPDYESETLPYLAHLAGDCEEWGLPLLAEMLPWGFQPHPESRSPERVATAVRIGAEMGADIIKTQFVGDVETFRRQVIAPCYVPVVVLGGSRMGSDAEVLETVASALDAGAAGVAMGRNIWQHPTPARMVAALGALIHGGATAGEALAELH
ncbi:MAG TPA: fructose-bisphosphate aldolase [Firmicutes bacterium]|nr:fructose-bisphosphate aldolase [Bacillota bacterium]